MVSAEQFAGIEFGLGVVRGARAFKVDLKTMDLTGVVYDQHWYPGENFAVCRKSGTAPSHPITNPVAPDHTMEGCQHGFYAYYDGSNDYRDSHELPFSGIVEGYGETLIGTKGFRSMRARLVALCPNFEVWDDPYMPHWVQKGYPVKHSGMSEMGPYGGQNQPVYPSPSYSPQTGQYTYYSNNLNPIAPYAGGSPAAQGNYPAPGGFVPPYGFVGGDVPQPYQNGALPERGAPVSVVEYNAMSDVCSVTYQDGTVVTVTGSEFKQGKYPRTSRGQILPRNGISRYFLNQVMEHYPEVPWFPDFDTMTREFPPDISHLKGDQEEAA